MKNIKEIYYELVYYDATKDYAGTQIQDYVFDIVNSNPVYE